MRGPLDGFGQVLPSLMECVMLTSSPGTPKPSFPPRGTLPTNSSARKRKLKGTKILKLLKGFVILILFLIWNNSELRHKKN
jgi:hypothetical protein